jgi:hypothetical protein
VTSSTGHTGVIKEHGKPKGAGVLKWKSVREVPGSIPSTAKIIIIIIIMEKKKKENPTLIRTRQ